MSVEIYRPNGPDTKPEYKIGTVGMEPVMPDGLLGKIITIARMGSPQLNMAYLTLSAIITKLDSSIPTYGLWTGPGWNAGERPSGSQIDWAELPCYNENVKSSPTPEDCYSLVDAICKTHDWQYVRPLTGSAIPQGSAIIIEYIPSRKKPKALQYAHMLCVTDYVKLYQK